MNQEDSALCDLHIHSEFSDSDASLEDIFNQASQKKIKCISITDHDTIAGAAKAHILGKKYNIEVINGIELSAQYKEVEVHILGYFIDINNTEFLSNLEKIKELRKERLLWMAEKLKSSGLEINEKELFDLIKDAIPTRLHLGLYLMKKGIVNSLKEAFKKYLSPGRLAYKIRIKYSVQESIEMIQKYGGLAILAHPHMLIYQSWIEEFIAMGIDGLELAYHNMPQAKRSLYTNIVIKSGLLKTGGSDAHGSYKEYIEVGGTTAPYEWVREMKQRLKKS